MVTAKGSSASVAIAERVNVHTCLGRPVEQSRLLTGLLLECPHSDGSERDERLLQGLREGGGGGDTFITALFDVSLAGDLPDSMSLAQNITKQKLMINKSPGRHYYVEIF